MKVGQLREMLDKLPDETWVFVRDRDGRLVDPFIDVVTGDNGDEVLVIA